MKITKLGDGLAVVIPDEVAEALNLRAGDDVQVQITPEKQRPTPQERKEIIARMREMARPLPEGWKFDREEANRRGND